MVDATALGGVVGDRAAGAAELVVEVDAGGEREEPGGDAGAEVWGGAGAVTFEPEQVFAGEEDGFDPLSDRGEANGAVGFVFAGGPDDHAAELADGVLELAAGVALVAEDRLATVKGSGEEGQRDFAFGTVGSDQACRSWGAVQGADEVQPHPPKPTGVALAISVAADLGKLGAAGGVERAAALDRGRVEQHKIVARARALGREHPDQPLDRVGQPPAPFVQRVLARQHGKQMAKLAASSTQEAAVAWYPHQHLRDTQGDDLRVAQLPASVRRPRRKKVIRRAIDADTEQVEVGAHRGLQVDVALATPTSTRSPWSLAATKPVASII